MDEYIKRQLAILTIQKYGVGCFDPDEFYPEQSERFVISKLNNIPAADVVEVRHGWWIDTGSGQKCSVCGEFQPGYDNYRNFCSNCGANMQSSKI